MLQNCKTCRYAFWGNDGNIQCEYNPHTRDPNGPIARWLCSKPQDVSTFDYDVPCPGWESYVSRR